MQGFLIFLGILIGLVALFFCASNHEAMKKLLSRDAAARESLAVAVAKATEPDAPVNGDPVRGFRPA